MSTRETIIRKLPDGRYQARVPRNDGTSNYLSRRFPTRGPAVQWAREKERELANGIEPEPQRGARFTVGDALAEHLRTWRGTWTPRTYRRKETVFRAHVSPQLRRLALTDLRATHVQAWVSELLLRYSARTVGHSLGHITKALDDQVENRRIATNPARTVKAPPVPKRDREVLTSEQVVALRDAFDPRYAVGVSLCYTAGLRRSEMLGLTWDRIDFLRHTITIDRQWYGRAFRGTKTAKSVPARVIPVPDGLLIELNAHKAAHGLGEHGLVIQGRPFKGRGAVALSDQAWHAAWKVAAAEVGLPAGTTTHALRHACGSRWAAEYPGQDARSARWMGHTLATFHRDYVHEIDDGKRVVMVDPMAPPAETAANRAHGVHNGGAPTPFTRSDLGK
jgi:integrase